MGPGLKSMTERSAQMPSAGSGQAEYNKLFQIGREKDYDDDDVRQWVDYALEHGLPDPKTGSGLRNCGD